MKVWAVANQKGGVGKTTTAVNLAGQLVRQQQRVLLVDMDPHGSMTAYFGFDPDSLEKSNYRLFQVPPHDMPQTAQGLVLPTSVEGLNLLPASTAMATIDRQLGAQKGKGLVLQQALQTLADKFDHILIDCPPLLGILMVNALAACQHLILPVQTEFLALKGLERMMHTLEMILKSRPGGLDYSIVATMFDRRTRAAHESLDMLRQLYREYLAKTVIPIDTLFREASKKGKPLTSLQPNSRGALAYAELLDELQKSKLSHLRLVNS